MSDKQQPPEDDELELPDDDDLDWVRDDWDDDEELILGASPDGGLDLEDPINQVASNESSEEDDERIGENFPDTWPALSGESPTELSEETVRNACLRLQELLGILERKCAAVRKVSDDEQAQKSHFEEQEGKHEIYQLLNEVLSHIRALTESDRIGVKFNTLCDKARYTTKRFGGDPRKAPNVYGLEFNAFSIMADHDLKNIVKAAQDVFPDLASASSAAPAPAPAASPPPPPPPPPSVPTATPAPTTPPAATTAPVASPTSPSAKKPTMFNPPERPKVPFGHMAIGSQTMRSQAIDLLQPQAQPQRPSTPTPPPTQAATEPPANQQNDTPPTE